MLKKGTYILGITTAASIWIAAAVGCQVALGNPWLAAAVAPAIALTSWLLGVLERKFFHRRRHMKTPSEFNGRRQRK